jgi:hypothetical protein
MMTMSKEMESYRTADQAASMLAKLKEVRAGIKRSRHADRESAAVLGGRLHQESSAMEESEEEYEEEEELEVGSDRHPLHSEEEDEGGRPLDLRRNSDESSEGDDEEDEEEEDEFFRPIKQGENVVLVICYRNLQE